MSPRVSFVVPCFKLGHLLPECVGSILSQTYRDFEVLIMDDASPDNTPEVAQSFRDPRVKHIRNEPNLGHLKNYNKGIGLSRGEYIWLISADDSLRSEHVLERYVELMDRKSNVGYVFCPAMKVEDGKDLGVMPYSLISSQNTVVSGHTFLEEHLIEANIVPAPAGMVRRICYEKVSLFPLDLPHSGDWYLWAMFALYFDVGFFAEAMVNRRFHESNMSTGFYIEAILKTYSDNLRVLLRIRERAERERFTRVFKRCTSGLASEYLRELSPARPGALGIGEFEESVRARVTDPEAQGAIRSQVYEWLGDLCFERGERSQALQYYQNALQNEPRKINLMTKHLLLRAGSAGSIVRRSLSIVRRQLRI